MRLSLWPPTISGHYTTNLDYRYSAMVMLALSPMTTSMLRPRAALRRLPDGLPVGEPVRGAAEKPQWEEEEDVLVDDETGLNLPAQLIVYNDDFNTFEWVIQCFIEVLGHTAEQSEQLALIIHFKGKATVKSGSKAELLPLREGLIDRGLSAVVEETS